MKSPCVLTFYLLAALTLVHSHALPRPHFRPRLLPRVVEEGRPGGEEEPGHGEPGRPVPGIIVPEGQVAPHEQEVEIYHQTVARSPNFEVNEEASKIQDNEVGLLDPPAEAGGEYRIEWTNPANSISTRDMQLARGQALRGDSVVRFARSNAKTENQERLDVIRREIADTNWKEEEGFNTYLSAGTPLDAMINKAYRLSLSEAVMRTSGQSTIAQSFEQDAHDDSPFTINFVDAHRPPTSDDNLPEPPILPGPPGADDNLPDPPVLPPPPPPEEPLTPVVDQSGHVIDWSGAFFPGDDHNPSFVYHPPEDDHPTQRRRRHRRSTLTTITNDVNSPNATSDDQAAQFQAYLLAYFTASSAISSALFPLLDAVLVGTNSSLAYNMAWSLYAELTGAPVQVTSPFSNGLNCIDWIEQSWRNQTANGTLLTVPGNSTHRANSTVQGKDVPMLQWLLAARTLLPVYEEVWTNMTTKSNATQYIKDLGTLSGYLLPKDKSLYTSGFNTTVQFTNKDMAYFTVRNETMGGSKRRR